MWRSISARKRSSGTKRATSSATTNCPTLSSPAGGAAKSRTSRPKAAPLSGPASSPMMSESSAPLVAADRQIGALADAARVGDRRPVLAALHPTLRHRPAVQLVAADRAIGGGGCGDIEDHRRLLAGRDRHRDRIGAEQRLGAAPGRHVIDARGRAIDANHAVLERDGRIDGTRSGMIGAPCADPADSARARQFDRELRGIAHDNMAHAIVAIDERSGGPALDHADRRLRVHHAAPELAHIARQPKHAVGIRSGEVGLQHGAGGGRRIGRGKAAGTESVGQECVDDGSRNALGLFSFALGQHVNVRTIRPPCRGAHAMRVSQHAASRPAAAYPRSSQHRHVLTRDLPTVD